MTNREWLNTLSTKDFIRKLRFENPCNICIRGKKKAEEYEDCSDYNCGQEMMKWLDAEHIEEGNNEEEKKEHL